MHTHALFHSLPPTNPPCTCTHTTPTTHKQIIHTDIETRKKATDNIKDSQELWHTKQYGKFLDVFFEPLVAQLTSTPPQFEDSELHKLRHSVLEVLSKLPPNDVLRPHMPKLLDLCLQLLQTDNQANGVLAMRVLLDLNKNLVRSQVQGFERQFEDCVKFIEKVSATAAGGGLVRWCSSWEGQHALWDAAAGGYACANCMSWVFVGRLLAPGKCRAATPCRTPRNS
jgi:hypothetical protein